MNRPTVADSIEAVRQWRASVDGVSADDSVGFVPTMGALHDGHRSLMRLAREQCDHVIVSVFVNPTQFGPGEDFAVYPRDRDGDVLCCADEGVDAVWFGDRDEIYPAGFATRVELPTLAGELCGRSRPGHFAGVALIVLKLFQIVAPDRAFFGWKDYQQFVLFRQMSRDLHLQTEVVGAPIVREDNGLARSSRNERLTAAGRESAAMLRQALKRAWRMHADGETRSSHLIRGALELLIPVARVRLEYLEVVDPETLQPLEMIVAQADSVVGVVAVAAWVDDVRLIDNIFLGPEGAQP